MLKASPYRWFCRVAQRFFPFCRSFFVVHFQTYSLFVAAVLPHVMHVAATCYAPDSCPKQKQLLCNTSRIDWQEHGNRLMEPWLVNCKRNNSGTAKKSIRKTIQRRTTSLTVAADLPMCRFFLIYIPCLSHQTYALVGAFFLSCRQQPTNLSADMAGRALCFKYLHIVI